MIHKTFNEASLDPNGKITRNISRWANKYKPPKYKHLGGDKKSVVFPKGTKSFLHDPFQTIVDRRISTPSMHKNFATVGCEQDLYGKIKFKLEDKQNLRQSINSTSSNFCRYKSQSEQGNKVRSKNIKLVQKSLSNSRKTRNNMTLDGMNLSSIDIKKKSCDTFIPGDKLIGAYPICSKFINNILPRRNTSTVIKMVSTKNLKGHHSKFASESSKKNQRTLETDMSTTQKKHPDLNTPEKHTTVSKERSVTNDLRESIETSLTHKIRILQKDLKK